MNFNSEWKILIEFMARHDFYLAFSYEMYGKNTKLFENVFEITICGIYFVKVAYNYFYALFRKMSEGERNDTYEQQNENSLET